MARKPQAWGWKWPRSLALLALLPAGCAVGSHDLNASFHTDAPIMAGTGETTVRASDTVLAAAAPARPFLPEGPYSLEQLLALALEYNPELRSAQARAGAARGVLIQAGLYPNPMVGWMADDLADNRNGAGKEGPSFSQEIVTAGKLRLAQAAASYGVSAADWQAVTRAYELLTRVRTRYYDVLSAQREVEENKKNVDLAEKGLDATKKLVAVAKAIKPDELRAIVELEQTRIQLGVAQQRADAAWKLLADAVGLPDLLPAPLQGKLEDEVPTYEYPQLLQVVLTRHSELQEAQALVLQAEREIRRAEVEPIPNLNFAITPFYDFPADDGRIFIQVGAALPIFNRNQGNILAARANLARAGEDTRQVELRLRDRLANAYENYRSAGLTVDAYMKKGGILENAEESVRLIQVLWASGDAKFDYTSVLESQRTLVRTRLEHVQAHNELWRAVSEIRGLLQEDGLAGAYPPACP